MRLNHAQLEKLKSLPPWFDEIVPRTRYQQKGRLLPFNEARAFARSLGIKTKKGWYAYSKSGKKPANVPAEPRIYDDWKGMRDWLGTGSCTAYLPFDEARSFVRALGLRGTAELAAYSKFGKRPANIPGRPDLIYRDKGWVNWPDWLGTSPLPYEEARAFARSSGIKNQKGWQAYAKSKKRPRNIFADPAKTYKGKGWAGYADWLGTTRRYLTRTEYLPFQEARAFVHSLHLRSVTEWGDYCRSGKKPANIPASPDSVYKEVWVSWPDWRGTWTPRLKARVNLVSNLRKAASPVRKPRAVALSRPSQGSLSWEEARAFARALNLRTPGEWFAYCESTKKPGNIPSHPRGRYKDDWINWGDWLGTAIPVSA